jgi:hypothetical protein
VVAEVVKGVDVEAITVRGGKAFPKFEIEDVVAKALAGQEMFRLVGQTNSE